MLSCANSEFSKITEVWSRRALLLAILFSVFFLHNTMYSDNPLPLKSLIIIPMLCLTAKVKLTPSNQGGVVATPLTVFPRSLSNAKEIYQGHIGNLFYILCGHFHEKNWGCHLTRFRVSRQSQRMREGGCCNLFSFKKKIIRHFEKYLHTMMLKLTEHVGITIFLLYKQKNTVKFWYSELLQRNFEFFEFSPIFHKKIEIFRSGMFLWRHN